MKKVLIVGANSYIAKSFEQYIATYQGTYQIESNQTALYHTNTYETDTYKTDTNETDAYEINKASSGVLEDKTIEIHKVSASNGEWKKVEFSNYDVILHLAGIAHIRETKRNEADYYRVNRDLAIEVALKAKESKVSQFIFMSTASVYGSKVTVITQDTIPYPTTHYGKSKLEAEKEIMKLQDEEFQVAIVRPPMVYGYGCKGNFAKLVKLAKIIPIFPDIENKRSMIYIDNLCEFLILLIDQEEGGYYHPQNEEYVCTSEMVKIIGESLGKKIYFTKRFNWLVRFMGKRIGSVEKMFGDWYYEFDLNNSPINKYNQIKINCQELDFKESIYRNII